MKRLFDSDLEIMVESNYIYFPLLFDPEINSEIQTISPPENQMEISAQPDSNLLLKLKGKYFVKTLNLHSLLENYEVINTYDYQRLRKDCLLKYQLTGEQDTIFLDETLRIILFQVMPHFIRKNRGLVRRKLSGEEILDLINERIKIPEKYYNDAETLQDLKSLKKVLESLENQAHMYKPPENGILTGRTLQDWLHDAIQTKVLISEHHRIAQALKVRNQLSQAKPEHIAVLLYIADAGSLEIDGFGFATHNAHKGEYLIYKRTGDYVLKDYYARSYFFPECRVAVSTYSPFRPFVMEKYKHPFLLNHKSGQEICMKDFVPSNELTANNIIRTLEEGLTALLYGYDSRRRNGYHSLDKLWTHIPTIDFEDYKI
jgi:hypothetical protein